MQIKRESNMELLRIIAMLMIILLHANWLSLGIPTREDILSSPLVTFWKVLAEQFCFVGVNVFVLISGWFGIKPSLKGLSSLMFQVLFWGTFLVIIWLVLGLEVSPRPIARVFLFGGYYWFIVAYVGLYLISPVLNSFVENTSPRRFLTVIICFFLAEFVYGWVLSSNSYNGGESVLSFIGLYLLARFLKCTPNKLVRLTPVTCFVAYIILSLATATLSYTGFRYGLHFFQLNPCYYCSPFVVAAATFFFLCFTNLSINGSIGSMINWIACSVFSVYIIHVHPLILPHFKSFFHTLSTQLSPFLYTLVSILLGSLIILCCAVLDRLRIWAWRLFCTRFWDHCLCNIQIKYNTLFDKHSSSQNASVRMERENQTDTK